MYVLDSIETEHRRLVRQAWLLEPLTERLFQEAGVGRGMRVLDLGCGMGDVSMLAARLVGPSGRVVGVDRDAFVLANASRRAEAAGFENIRFLILTSLICLRASRSTPLSADSFWRFCPTQSAY